jgi:23S rRNA (adenine2503-C2)-methyltransferase
MDTGKQINLLDLSLKETEDLLSSMGETAFRARQIWHWMFKELATDVDRMTNLPKPLRERISDQATIGVLDALRTTPSDNGLTQKALLGLADGCTIESVLLLYPHVSNPRRTVCVSSQAGCAAGCAFCATGQTGLQRNLTPGEIVGQVLHFARLLRAINGVENRVTNLVFMGQGEPFANFEAVWQAIQSLNSPYGLNLGARHMTISTVGVVPGILQLAELPLQIGLAVSLHAPNDALRQRLVPIAQTYPLAELLAACRVYTEQTSRRVTFEYALLKDVNDDVSLAKELAHRLRGMLCHVNLIPFNTVEGVDFEPSPPPVVSAFAHELKNNGIVVTVRQGRGGSIDAACGQLRARAAEEDVYEEQPPVVRRAPAPPPRFTPAPTRRDEPSRQSPSPFNATSRTRPSAFRSSTAGNRPPQQSGERPPRPQRTGTAGPSDRGDISRRDGGRPYGPPGRSQRDERLPARDGSPRDRNQNQPRDGANGRTPEGRSAYPSRGGPPTRPARPGGDDRRNRPGDVPRRPAVRQDSDRRPDQPPRTYSPGGTRPARPDRPTGRPEQPERRPLLPGQPTRPRSNETPWGGRPSGPGGRPPRRPGSDRPGSRPFRPGGGPDRGPNVGQREPSGTNRRPEEDDKGPETS